MITSIAKIITHFPGAANRARCTAHIVNLVSKIILRQFDATKKTNGRKKTSENANEPKTGTEATELDDEDDITSLAEGLEREEQEVADDEDNDMNIAGDL